MPAHIYIRVGRYADAAEANERAIVADEDYLAQCQAQGLYPVSYYPHNLHFLWAAATLEGRRAVAVDAARKSPPKCRITMRAPLAWTADFPGDADARLRALRTVAGGADRAAAAVATSRMRSGSGTTTRAWRSSRVGRSIAPAPSSPRSKATMKHEAFTTTLKDLPLLTNLQIASRILEGEMSCAEATPETAIAALQEAVTIEDGIPYNEPPVWHHPPRQVLGAMLLEAGRPRRPKPCIARTCSASARTVVALRAGAESAGAASRSGRGRRRAAAVRARVGARRRHADLVADHDRRSRRRRERIGRPIQLPTGVRLNYVEQGDPARHAGRAAARLLRTRGARTSRILPLLPRIVRVFAVTQRGHGDSSKPETGYAAGATSPRDLAAFLDAMGLDSRGRRRALDGLARRAAVCDRLSGTHARAGARGRVPASRRQRRRFVSLGRPSRRSPIRSIRRSSASFSRARVARPVPPDFFEDVVGDSLKVPARVWKGALEPYLTMDFLPRLSEIAAPTLMIWGDRDAFIGRPEQDVLTGAIAGSRLVTYAGTGHSPHWEEPERFSADLLAFIRSVDAP